MDGRKLLCNRTTGSKPGFLGYHRQTRGVGASRGGRGRRGRASSQHQVSPKATASFGGHLLKVIPPDKYFSLSLLF